MKKTLKGTNFIMKKTICSIIVFLLLIGTLSGCGSQAEKLSVRIEGSIFNGNGVESTAAELKFDPDWIIKGDNCKYNKELASFAALLSADTYFREKDLAKGTQNRVLIEGSDPEEYTWTTMLTQLGFTDARHIESFEEECDFDVNDSVTMNLGYMQQGDNDIYVAAVRGCFSSGEWSSAFDPGSGTEEYEQYTGKHPDWVNKSNLKGFDVAASRALRIINSFMIEHEDASRNTYFLITGHSRGASIAQIVGAYMEKTSGIKSFTYTFNSVPCSNDPEAENYKSIFNIVDEGDFFGNLFCFASEPLYRYGKTLSGRSGNGIVSTELMSEYVSLFQSHFPDRSSLYKKKYISEVYDDTGAVASRTDAVNSVINSESGFGFEAYCTVFEEDDYSIMLEYTDAVQIQCIGKVLTYGSAAADAAKILFESDTEFCSIIDFIVANSAEISSGHLISNTYELCKNVK